MAGERVGAPAIGATYAICDDRRFRVTVVLDDGAAVGGATIGPDEQRHGYAEFTLEQISALEKVTIDDYGSRVIACRKVVVGGKGVHCRYTSNRQTNTTSSRHNTHVHQKHSVLTMLIRLFRLNRRA